MKTSIFVPKKINVGFQNRSGTYTGKLAYIIYFDEKGKLRKETSWNGWRDEKIPNEIYDNEPTSGFVLNKKVGGVEESWGWDPRKTYTRVYDPRGFELEITIPNLLWILENCNCIKGKGLEGEFVYGWDGKELLLIPTSSPDYQEIDKYNSVVHNNTSIRTKDLVVGATYLTKDNSKSIYVGKFDFYDSGYQWEEEGQIKTCAHYKDVPQQYKSSYSCRWKRGGINVGKHFYFAYKHGDGKWCFSALKTIPKNYFIDCIDNSCTSEYGNIYEALQCWCNYSPYDSSRDIYFNILIEDFIESGTYIDSDGIKCFKCVEFISEYDGIKRTYKANHLSTSKENKYELQVCTDENNNSYWGSFKDELTIFPTVTKTETSYWGRTATVTRMIPVSLEEIFAKMKPMGRQQYLQNGKEYRKVWSMRNE